MKNRLTLKHLAKVKIPAWAWMAILLVAAPGLPFAATAQRSIPDDLTIVMKRFNCEDGCPVYRIVIFGDGDVIWDGRNGVAHPGVSRATIPPDAIRALIEDFESVHYFDLADIYGYRGSGCGKAAPGKPVVLLLFALDGRSRTLWHHDGCAGAVSEKLTALEESIDRAVGAERWITGKSSRREK
jgi:Domain of unknown function (DUF6438)